MGGPHNRLNTFNNNQIFSSDGKRSTVSRLIYQNTWRNIPEDSTVLSYCLDITKLPYIPVFVFRAFYWTNGITVKIEKKGSGIWEGLSRKMSCTTHR
jgi:hypothetical protein